MKENKKQRRISVVVSKTINTGNYESMKVQASYEATIKDSDDIDEEYENAWEIAEEQVDSFVINSVEK